MPFGLGGPGAEITIQTDKEKYRLGDEVKVKVQIRGKKDFNISNATLKFSIFENIEEYYQVPGSKRLSSESTQIAHFLPGSKISTLERNTRITRSFLRQYEKTFSLPLENPPTYSHKEDRIPLLQIQYLVQVILETGRLKKALKEELGVPVFSKDRKVSDEPIEVSSSSNEADLKILLSKKDFRIGNLVEGKVVITPKKDFNVKDLKVKLRLLEEGREHDCDMKGLVSNINPISYLREKVKNKFVKKSFTVGEHRANSIRKGFTKFTKDIPKEFPFSFPLNIAMTPSFQTERSQADWLIEAKLEKGFGRDQSLKAVIQVLSI